MVIYNTLSNYNDQTLVINYNKSCYKQRGGIFDEEALILEKVQNKLSKEQN